LAEKPLSEEKKIFSMWIEIHILSQTDDDKLETGVTFILQQQGAPFFFSVADRT
jgi:hypothetical protein